MIKRIKSNKIISYSLIIMCIIIMINPTIYAKSCLNAISVWSTNILPILFPFFVFTRLIVNNTNSSTNVLDKFFCKAYNAPKGSLTTFLLSSLSGYPMGAKLICTSYESGYISNKQAEKMLSFCSVSGPMFMLGSVGLMMLKSYKAGLIILISNILASLINGLIFRGKKDSFNTKPIYTKQKNTTSLSDCVYDSLISILMVGAYIVLSFLLIEILKTLNIFDKLSTAICSVCNMKSSHNVVSSILYGLIEITHGILDLSTTTISLTLKTIIASGLIGFGGVSVMLQSLNFLAKLNISVNKIILQKTSQAILCLLIATSLAIIFL